METPLRRRALGVLMAVLAVVWPLVCPAPWEAGHTVLGRLPAFALGVWFGSSLKNNVQPSYRICIGLAVCPLLWVDAVPRLAVLLVLAAVLFWAVYIAERYGDCPHRQIQQKQEKGEGGQHGKQYGGTGAHLFQLLVIDEIFLDQFGVEYLHEVSQHEVGIYDRRLIVVVAASSIGAGVVVIAASENGKNVGLDETSAAGCDITFSESLFNESGVCYFTITPKAGYTLSDGYTVKVGTEVLSPKNNYNPKTGQWFFWSNKSMTDYTIHVEGISPAA